MSLFGSGNGIQERTYESNFNSIAECHAALKDIRIETEGRDVSRSVEAFCAESEPKLIK